MVPLFHIEAGDTTEFTVQGDFTRAPRYAAWMDLTTDEFADFEQVEMQWREWQKRIRNARDEWDNR